MQKFLVIYHATQEAMIQMASATPEQRAASIQPWMDWKAKVGNHLVDFGAPVMGGLNITKSGEAIPSTHEISGFSIIQADNKDKALELLADHPHNNWDAGYKVELHEFIPM